MRYHLLPFLVPEGCRYQVVTHEDQRLDYFIDETMNGSFIELLQRKWYYRIFFQPWMSWEIEAKPESIKYYYWATDNRSGEEIKNKLLAYHPDIEIWPAENKLDIRHYCKGTRLKLKRHYSVTIKTFFNDLVDTQAPIITAMTDLRNNETAWLQILLKPAVGWKRRVQKAQKIVAQWVEDATRELVEKSVHSKTFKTSAEVEIRIVAESPDKARVKQVVKNIARSFGQFASEGLNSFEAKEFWLTIQPLLLHDFKKRIFPFYTLQDHKRVLNIEELSGLVRLPSRNIQVPQLLRLKMKKVAAPVEVISLSKELEDKGNQGQPIVSIGKNIYRSQQVPVYLNLASLNRHMMIFGATQMGKSSFIVNMLQDAMKLKLQGHKIGFEVIDPHGSLCQDIAALAPPELDDEILYIKPAYENGAFPFNLYDVDFQTTPDRIAQSVADALSRIWPDFWGPNIDDNLLQAGIGLQRLGMANIFNVRRLISNAGFREKIVEQLDRFPECEGIVEFFRKLDDLPERSLNERTNSTLNKLRKIEASETLKNSLGQPICGVKWRESMDRALITLWDLSGLTEEEKRIYGSIALTRRYQAALSRIDQPEEDRALFLEVIDESPKFMDANEKAIEAMADECRKFNLGLVAASQGMDEQIPDGAAAAILRNFGSLVVYRVPSPKDAKTLAEAFSHVEIEPENIQKIDKNNAYLRLAVGRDTTKAFSCQMKAPEPVSKDQREKRVKELIEKTIARVRKEVKECMSKMELGQETEPTLAMDISIIDNLPGEEEIGETEYKDTGLVIEEKPENAEDDDTNSDNAQAEVALLVEQNIFQETPSVTEDNISESQYKDADDKQSVSYDISVLEEVKQGEIDPAVSVDQEKQDGCVDSKKGPKSLDISVLEEGGDI